jgi:hypothetical protein
MHHQLYLGQRNFGMRSWLEFAVRAAVADTPEFEKCQTGNAFDARINAGVLLGRQLAIAGTPAVLVSGWLVDPALPESVEETVNAVIEGRTPKLKGGRK